MLLDLQPDTMQQGELALEDDEGPDRGRLMTTLDGLNLRYGRGTVLMASAGLAGDKRAWSMKQERRTPGYTTCWADMPLVGAGLRGRAYPNPTAHHPALIDFIAF